mmetsp:Transcript_43909/g.58228  ORF Transcript_43909/g.58228 Transcript_43909/m.58228 type:complete len:167 (+) Transcript_43909:132-632(+)
MIGLRDSTKKNFLDYIYGGCEIKLSVAVDYSKSNGDQSSPGSLHNLQDNNLYVQAIEQAVAIMQYYNASKKIAAYGFGARVVRNHETSNCFALTADIFNPYVKGIKGLIEAHERTLQQVELSQPAQLTEVIETVMNRAEDGGGSLDDKHQKYHVLMILTNGEIDDI